MILCFDLTLCNLPYFELSSIVRHKHYCRGTSYRNANVRPGYLVGTVIYHFLTRQSFSTEKGGRGVKLILHDCESNGYL